MPSRYAYIKGLLELLIEQYGDCLDSWERVNFPNMLDPTRKEHQQEAWAPGQERKIEEAYTRIVVQADDMRDDAIERIGDCKSVPTAHNMIQMTVYDVDVGRPISHRLAKELLPWLASAVGGLRSALADADAPVEMTGITEDF